MVLCPFCAEQAAVAPQPDGQMRLSACRECLNPFLITAEGGELRSRPLEDVPAVDEMAMPGSVMAHVLGTLGSALNTLPVLPQVPQRIVAMIHDPLVAMQDLAEVINEDPVIAVKILKVANSSYFGGTQEIKEVSTACARLGLKAVANLVMSISTRDLYRTKNAQFLTLMQQMWEHALATAHCAHDIAGMVTGADGDGAFLAGLTHQIGKLVLFDMITIKHTGSVGRLRESPELLIEVLDQYYALVGLHVVLRWELPPELAFTTFCHSKPEMTPSREWLTLTHIVALARACSHAAGFGSGQMPSRPPATLPSTQYLKIPEDKLAALWRELPDRIEPLLQAIARL